MGAQMLNDLGVHAIRLITNNPRKIAGLKGYGLEVVDRVPLLIESNDFNTRYLNTKAQKLGHMLLQTHLATIALRWQGKDNVTQRYEHLERLRHLTQKQHLLVREEARPVASAVFSNAPLIVHLGFDQAKLARADWYTDTQHPYLQAIASLLGDIAQWDDLTELEFMIATGDDPMTGLQIQLDREFLAWLQLPTFIQAAPVKTQTIYHFQQPK